MTKARTKEQQLFNLLHSNGDEYMGDGFHSYKVDDEDGIRYRCDCGKMGSFEVARLEKSEEFNLILKEWEDKDETWYVYDGKYSDDLPEFVIELALKYLERKTT